MRNITVSVDDDTYRRSRIRAAELETSVSALVRGFLERLVREPARASGECGVAAETGLERRRRLLEEVVADFDARGVGLRMADNLSREELYDRSRARAEAAETAGSTEGECRRRLLDEVFEDICATRGGFRAADNVGREVLHDRDAIR